MSEGVTAGRERQRRRTRRAIVEAAGRLLTNGATPSVAEIAEQADVARRTVYLYFPTLDQLLIEAALATTPDLPEFADTDDPAVRLDTFVRSSQRSAAKTEHIGRTLIKLTMEAEANHAGMPRRGYRRVEWIEQVLAPLAGRVEPDRLDRLTSALVLVVGWEPTLTLRDVRGHEPDEIENITAWIAQVLLAATLAERSTDNG